VADRNALSWVQWLRLVRLDERTAHLEAAPGRRDVMKFLTERQKTQLSDLLRPIVGRGLRIELEQSQPMTTAEEASAHATTEKEEDESRMTPRQALALPLVKQVMAVFDADIVQVRPADRGDSKPPAEPLTEEPNDV